LPVERFQRRPQKAVGREAESGLGGETGSIATNFAAAGGTVGFNSGLGFLGS
jgi:hypothetical protein